MTLFFASLRFHVISLNVGFLTCCGPLMI